MGPGDDARVEFGPQVPPIEIQAKHGFKGRVVTEEVVSTIRQASTADYAPAVFLVVDSTASLSIRNDFRLDLDRIRSGRTDCLKELTRCLLETDADSLATLTRLYVLVLDVYNRGDCDLARAHELITDHLEDPSQAEAAWAVLQSDAAHMCATRLVAHGTRSVLDRYNVVSDGDLRTAATQLNGLTGTIQGQFRDNASKVGGESLKTAKFGGAARI